MRCGPSLQLILLLNVAAAALGGNCYEVKIPYPVVPQHITFCSMTPSTGPNTLNEVETTVSGDFTVLVNWEKIISHAALYFGTPELGCILPENPDGFLNCNCSTDNIQKPIRTTSYRCRVPQLFGIQPLYLRLVYYPSAIASIIDLVIPNMAFQYNAPQLFSIDPPSGVFGTVVKLTGVNFGGNATFFHVFRDGGSTDIAAEASYGAGAGGNDTVYFTVADHYVGRAQLTVLIGIQLPNGSWTGSWSEAPITFTFDAPPPPSPSPSPPSKLWSVLAPCLGTLVLTLLGAAVYMYRVHYRPDSLRNKPSLSKLARRSTLTSPSAVIAESLIQYGVHLLEKQWQKQWRIEQREVRLGKEVGKGSFAAVHRGKWHGQTVAVKIFLGAGEAEEQKNFADECMLLSSLHHPNVVQLFGCISAKRSDGTWDLMLVTEFMERGSLLDQLQAAPVGLRDLLTMTADAASGMVYLHAHDPVILHRDLKTANLLVDARGRVKIADFGLSRPQADDGLMTACGTPKYAAPEVLNHSRYGTAADVWSFGVIIWECWCLEPPYKDTPALQVCVKVAAVGSFLEMPSHFPPCLAALVNRCLRFQPEDRPSFQEVYAELRAMLDLAGQTGAATDAGVVIAGGSGIGGGGAASAAAEAPTLSPHASGVN